MPAEPPRDDDPGAVDARAVRRHFARAAATYDGAAVLQREVVAPDGRAARRREARPRGHPRRGLRHRRRAGRSRAPVSGAPARSRSTSRCRCFAWRSRKAGQRRSALARLFSAFKGADPAGDRFRLRRRRRAAARCGCVRPRVEQPGAAMGGRPAAGARRARPRAARRRARHVLDVRPRHAARAARGLRGRGPALARRADSPTCTTSATCWSTRASATR